MHLYIKYLHLIQHFLATSILQCTIKIRTSFIVVFHPAPLLDSSTARCVALVFCAMRAGFDSADRMRAFFPDIAVHETLLGEDRRNQARLVPRRCAGQGAGPARDADRRPAAR